MAVSRAMTREALYREVRECWQRTEDAIDIFRKNSDTVAPADRTIEDLFRHLTAANYYMPARIRVLLATGELPPANEENAEGIENFAPLDYHALRTELHSAHTVAWRYIRRFSYEDLAERFTIHGQEQTLGEVIRDLVWRDGKVESMLREANIEPIFDYSSEYDSLFGLSLRLKESTNSHRYPELEMLAERAGWRDKGRKFATLVHISGIWWLDLDGKSLTTYPTREEAWETARRDYVRATCEYCGKTGYGRPRSDGRPPRPYWMCPNCWKAKALKQSARRKRSRSSGLLLQARRKAQGTSIRGAQAALYRAIEEAEAIGDVETINHLELALPHIEAAAFSDSS